jgi:hypothetical protein
MRGLIVLAATALIAGVFAAPAGAATTRADYAAQVNPICATANGQVDQVYADLKRAFRKFEGTYAGKKIRRLEKHQTRLNRQLHERTEAITTIELGQLGQVVPASGDEEIVSKWIANRRVLQGLAIASNELSERADRIFNRLFSGKNARSYIRNERKLDRVQRQSGRLYQQIRLAEGVDLELGTQLGATYCVTGASGT